MSRPATPKKAVAMCCVRIGYEDFLLPKDEGLKLVSIMTSAFLVDKNYISGRGYVFLVGEQPQVSLELVKPTQIKPKTDADGQLTIGMD